MCLTGRVLNDNYTHNRFKIGFNNIKWCNMLGLTCNDMGCM